MVNINFTQFRQHAKEYFDAVAKGERIRILRHGKVIAEISPPQQPTPSWKTVHPKIEIPKKASAIIITEREASDKRLR